MDIDRRVTEKNVQGFDMNCYQRLLNILYKECDDVLRNIQAAIG